jgi:hypothetical protein
MRITRYRGDTYRIRIQARDKVTKAAVDLTGATAVLSVSSTLEPSSAPDVFTVAGVIPAPATQGIVDFEPPGNTAPGLYYYDIQITDAQGKIRTLIKDEYEIVQDITK